MLDFDVELKMLDGSTRSLSEFRGKLLMIVNVASRCGLSPQYEQLEQLQKKYGERGLVVLGVPSGSFKQELKDDEAIGEYCSTTWGVTFPMTQKTDVNGRNRHPLYKQLVKAKDSKGLAGPVLWNFEKYLVLPNGDVHRFRPIMKPDDPKIIELIEKNLPN